MGKPYFGLVGKQLNLAIATIAGIGFLLFGYDQGVMGSLLTRTPTFVQTFPEIDLTPKDLSSSEKMHRSTIQGATIGIYEIGCMAGALSCLLVGDKIGRRKTIFAGAWVMLAGAVIQCTSFGIAQLVVGRIVTGYGNGFITATVPTWQSECSKPEARGKLVMIEGALITGGIMISYWIDFAFYWISGSTVSWRFPIAFQIIFAIVLILFVLPLPESPRWLIKVGRSEEASRVLAALADTTTDDVLIRAEIAEIKGTLKAENGGLRYIFTNGKERHFHRTALGFVNQMFQQISAINLITYYSGTIFEQYIGLAPTTSKILAAANGTEYFLASWIAVYTIESFGRRKLMMFGAIGMSASMAILCGTNSISDHNNAAAIVAAIFLFVFNTFFAIGWLGMTWLYPAEIVSLQIRAPANGISTAANWIFNFMIVMITPIAFESIGFWTYGIFAFVNAAIVPCVYFFFPETAGRSLEEMDEIFAQSKSIFDVVGIAARMPRRDVKSKLAQGGRIGDGSGTLNGVEVEDEKKVMGLEEGREEVAVAQVETVGRDHV